MTHETYLIFQPGAMPEGDHFSAHTVATVGLNQRGVAAAFVFRP